MNKGDKDINDLIRKDRNRINKYYRKNPKTKIPYTDRNKQLDTKVCNPFLCSTCKRKDKDAT